MKKYIFLAATALLAMCACTKNEVTALPDQEISFQVANYMSQTKANVAFDQKLTFGTYAWQNPLPAGKAPMFMNNQEIGYSGSVWKATDKVYYWPKTGGVDFISYAPYAGTPWLTVTSSKLSASVSALAADADYLYADKAVGYSSNVDQIKDNVESGLTGVPTLFHHALAQVGAKVYAAKLFDGETLAKSDVRWEIKVVSASLNKVADAGELSMNLAPSSSANGQIVNWVLPTNEVWSTTAYRKSYTFAAPDVTAITPAEAHDLLAYTSVVPQTFVAEPTPTTDGTQVKETPEEVIPTGQYISITVEVKSYNKKNAEDSGITNLYSTETYTKNIPLTAMTSNGGANVSWKMNYRYLYYICIDPSSQVAITFDPAVTAWTEVTGEDYWVL